MTFQGQVWRYVPAGADPFHAHFLIHAGGRWNRRGRYGAFYTAPSPRAAIAEYRKILTRRGFDDPSDLVSFTVRVEDVFDLAAVVGFPGGVSTVPTSPAGSGVEWADSATAGRRVPLGPGLGSIGLGHLVGNAPTDLEACRSLADRVRAEGFLGILAPSAAEIGAVVLVVYPENRPGELELGPTVIQRVPLNYGSDAVLDAAGRVARAIS